MSLDVTTKSDLVIDGMTCAACANRIQRRLGKLDAVSEAQVNFATGRATVTHVTAINDAELAAEIEALGYAVIDANDGDEAEDRREADLLRRLIVGVALSIPAMLISMVPALRFEGWEWLVAVLSMPCLLYTSPSPRDRTRSRMPSSA